MSAFETANNLRINHDRQSQQTLTVAQPTVQGNPQLTASEVPLRPKDDVELRANPMNRLMTLSDTQREHELQAQQTVTVAQPTAHSNVQFTAPSAQPRRRGHNTRPGRGMHNTRPMSNADRESWRSRRAAFQQRAARREEGNSNNNSPHLGFTPRS